MELEVNNISLQINERQILENIKLHVESREMVGLLGPNGSGKSTLLKNIYRTLKPDSGWVSLQGNDVNQLRSKTVAKQMAVVRQESTIQFDFTVREIVAMGRFPHRSSWQSNSSEDEQIINNTLVRVGMNEFSERHFNTLSGGEKQRVLIARALAQQAKLIVLDEPTNHLDIHSQIQIMDILKSLNCSVLTALHDLNIAAFYCDRLYIMQDGKLVATGTPEEVLQPSIINKVFNVNCEVMIHPKTLKPHIMFLSAQS